MLNTGNKEASIKYTTVLPKQCLDDLKILTERKVILSVSQGIRLAIEGFIESQNRYHYELSMKDAAVDSAFIKRTMDTQADFKAVDEEGEDAW